MQLLDIIEITSSHQHAIDWARRCGLLRQVVPCIICREAMTPTPNNEAPDFEAMHCRSCHLKKSIRCDSLFFRGNLSIKKIILLLYFFSKNTSNAEAARELDLTDKTVTQWYSRFRKVCIWYFEVLARDEVLGGLNSIVEIDESLITRRKYNRGRVVSKRWVFGAIERREDGQYRSFVEFVENRREDTLLEIIRRRIAPGTTIISDGWAAYRNLGQYNYCHQVINHSENFVDPANRSIHTQNIENNWKNIKRWLRNKGTNLGSAFHEYLLEYLYKKRYAEDVFVALINHIAQMH